MGRFTEIGAAAWRISRLLADGTPDFGNAVGALALCGGVTSLTGDFEIEEGTEHFAKDSIGAPCVSFRDDDVEKWINFEIELCKDAYEIWEILGLAEAFTDASDNVIGIGHTMAAGCEVTSRDRVFLELWTRKIDCDTLIGYVRHVFTNVQMTPTFADRGEDPTTPSFSGRGFNNPNIDNGPFGDLDDLGLPADFAGAYIKLDDVALPTCPEEFGYEPIPAFSP